MSTRRRSRPRTHTVYRTRKSGISPMMVGGIVLAGVVGYMLWSSSNANAAMNNSLGSGGGGGGGGSTTPSTSGGGGGSTTNVSENVDDSTNILSGDFNDIGNTISNFFGGGDSSDDSDD